MPAASFDRVFPKTTLKRIFETLIAGFDGLPIEGDTILTAKANPDRIEKTSDAALPFLNFDIGSAKLTPWQFWTEYLSWDINATLKVHGPSEDVKILILIAQQAIWEQTKRLIGLPIDEAGNVVSFTPKSARRFDTGELTFLCERGAPYLTNMSAPVIDGHYATSGITFHIETTIGMDPRVDIPKALYPFMGIRPVYPGQTFTDSTLPPPVAVAAFSDLERQGWTAYNTSDTSSGGNRRVIPNVQGTTPDKQLRDIVLTPQSATLTAGSPTAQIQAIARFQNWSSAYVTGLGATSWTSTSPSVASVSSAGLVTRVAAGTTSITCSYGGATSSVSSITCT